VSQKKQEVLTTDRWEALKNNAIEVESILLHQAGAVFTSTQQTINATKPTFKGIKMWRSAAGYLLELGSKREFLETTSVFKCIPK
jgi:hypothetical protein